MTHSTNGVGARDIAEVRFLIRVRHAWAIIVTVSVLSSGAVAGWMTLKSDIARANLAATGLQAEVREIRCLLRQQNEHQIYKRAPTYDCAQPHQAKPPA